MPTLSSSNLGNPKYMVRQSIQFFLVGNENMIWTSFSRKSLDVSFQDWDRGTRVKGPRLLLSFSSPIPKELLTVSMWASVNHYHQVHPLSNQCKERKESGDRSLFPCKDPTWHFYYSLLLTFHWSELSETRWSLAASEPEKCILGGQ